MRTHSLILQLTSFSDSNSFMTVGPDVISRRCLLVAVVLWPMCCHTGMPRRRQRTWHFTPSQYRHRADLSLCYPLVWNITLEYTTTNFNVLGQTRSRDPSLTFHTHQRTLNRFWYGDCQPVAPRVILRGFWRYDFPSENRPQHWG